MERITISVEGYARTQREAKELVDMLFAWPRTNTHCGVQINLSCEVHTTDSSGSGDVFQIGAPENPVVSHPTEQSSPEHDVVRYLYRVREVTKSLAISERTAWNLVSSGQLRSVKIGNSTRIRLADLERFVEGLENTARW
jgi:excisionase family DNA binding protein